MAVTADDIEGNLVEEDLSLMDNLISAEKQKKLEQQIQDSKKKSADSGIRGSGTDVRLDKVAELFAQDVKLRDGLSVSEWALLLQHPGPDVTTEELSKQLWPRYHSPDRDAQITEDRSTSLEGCIADTPPSQLPRGENQLRHTTAPYLSRDMWPTIRNCRGEDGAGKAAFLSMIKGDPVDCNVKKWFKFLELFRSEILHEVPRACKLDDGQLAAFPTNGAEEITLLKFQAYLWKTMQGTLGYSLPALSTVSVAFQTFRMAQYCFCDAFEDPNKSVKAKKYWNVVHPTTFTAALRLTYGSMITLPRRTASIATRDTYCHVMHSVASYPDLHSKGTARQKEQTAFKSIQAAAIISHEMHTANRPSSMVGSADSRRKLLGDLVTDGTLGWVPFTGLTLRHCDLMGFRGERTAHEWRSFYCDCSTLCLS